MSGGACCCGVLCSSRACAVPALSTSSAASGRCSRNPSRGLLRAAHSEVLLSPRCIGSSDRADCADAFFWPVSIDLCIVLLSHCDSSSTPPAHAFATSTVLGGLGALDDRILSLCLALPLLWENFTLVFTERYSAFLRPVHVAKRCVTLFLDVLLHVLHPGSHPAC